MELWLGGIHYNSRRGMGGKYRMRLAHITQWVCHPATDSLLTYLVQYDNRPRCTLSLQLLCAGQRLSWATHYGVRASALSHFWHNACIILTKCSLPDWKLQNLDSLDSACLIQLHFFYIAKMSYR